MDHVQETPKEVIEIKRISSYRPGNNAAGGPFDSRVVRGRKFLRNRTAVKCHVSRWCGWYLSLWCTVRKFRQVTGQTVLQNTPHDKCGRQRTARRHLYGKPMCQALHRWLGPQCFERLHVVCDQMGQADTRVHQPIDENSNLYEA